MTPLPFRRPRPVAPTPAWLAPALIALLYALGVWLAVASLRVMW